MELSEMDKAFVRQEVKKIVEAIEKLTKAIKALKPLRSIGPR